MTADRTVARTEIAPGIEVSTVFLSMNLAFPWDDRPLLFETIVFGGRLDGACRRYHTYDEAEAGHQAMVMQVRQTEGIAAGSTLSMN